MTHAGAAAALTLQTPKAAMLDTCTTGDGSAAKRDQERPAAAVAHHQHACAQKHLVLPVEPARQSAGSGSSSGCPFNRVQWLLSGADAWHPSAAEFEADCQVAGKLGKGALTDVYKVKFKGVYVALKVVRPTRSTVPMGLLPESVLFREARALKYCRHSNIVRCRGLVRVPAGVKCFGDPNSHWAMLEELLSSGSLAHMILRQMGAPSLPAYSRTDALNWTLDIARAVAHMHSLEPLVVHGHLKLENVLLAKGGEPGARRVAKLTDLGRHTLVGHAKADDTSRSDQQQQQRQQQQQQQQAVSSPHSTSGAVSSSSISSATVSSPRVSSGALSSSPRVSSGAADKLFQQLTGHDQRGTGDCLLDGLLETEGVLRAAVPDDTTGHTGSYMYMAPEVFRCEPYNEKADIFSLAVILYQLLSRSLLIFSDLRTTDAADDKQYAAKMAKGYRPDRLAGVPGPLWHVIERCWAQEPKDRPDAKWVVQQLEAALQAEAKEVATGGGAKVSARTAPNGIRGAYQSKQSSAGKASSGKGNSGKESGSKQSSSKQTANGKGQELSKAAAVADSGGGGGGCCVIS